MQLTDLRLTLLLALGLTGCDPVSGVVIPDTGDTDPVAGCGGAPILVGGVPTGFARCADGAIHRVEAVTGVTTSTPRPTCTAQEGDCSSDADCSSGVAGRCLEAPDYGFGEVFCACDYSCASDADCGEGRICLPPGVWEEGPDRGRCIPAACTTDSDCPSSECGLSAWNDGCGWDVKLVCRSDADACRTDAECQARGDGQYCGVGTGSQTYACQMEDCAIGRPLAVGTVWKAAPVVPSRDWADPEVLAAAVGLDDLDPATRTRRAGEYARIAALEHASVASFARHSLELLSLGAPAELLAEVQQAAADEVRHARVMFALASAFGGSPVGPGPLDLTGVTPRQGPRAIFRAVFLEGAVGESLGAAEAHAEAEASDGVLAELLAGIAADETRHAALAWKTLRWMLTAFPETRAELQRLVSTPPDLASDGLRADVWRQVIEPLGRSLLGERLERSHTESRRGTEDPQRTTPL